MTITDLPAVALLVGVAVLLVSTVLLFRTLPGTLPAPLARIVASVARWGRGRRGRGRRRPERLAVTGRMPALPPGPIPPAVARQPIPVAPRQPRPRPDAPDRAPTLQEAHATIERLLERDPDRLAQVMMQWIRDDDPPAGRTP